MKLIEVDYISTLEKLENIDKGCTYFQEKDFKKKEKELAKGYKEMEEINRSLSELGLEQDVKELDLYEAVLIGCELL